VNYESIHEDSRSDFGSSETSQRVNPKGDVRTSTAYHEAGHAVADLMLGFEFDSATIVPNAEARSLGAVMGPHAVFGYHGSGRRERARRVRDAIVAFYAGLAAEHVCCGVAFSFEDDAEHGAWGDHHKAWDLLRQHGDAPRCRVVGDEAFCEELERLQRKAVQLVRRHRAAVDAVAQALLARNTMSGEEVRQILNPLGYTGVRYLRSATAHARERQILPS
jgi:ATP-dependent Zn protease